MPPTPGWLKHIGHLLRTSSLGTDSAHILLRHEDACNRLSTKLSAAAVTARVAFLRAVNLGKRTVKMSRLVDVFAGLGHSDASTYINSGNVAFDAAGSGADIERSIERALETEFGFEVTTFVRTAAELRRVVEAEPFAVADGDTYFVTFLKARPNAATVRALQSLSNDFDTLVVRGRDVHWRMHGKSTDSRLKKKDWEIVGKNNSTSRNINMLRKFAAKLAD